MTPQEALNYCDKAVTCCFLCLSELLEEFLAFYDLYSWSDKDISFDVCHRQLREEVLSVLEGGKLLYLEL